MKIYYRFSILLFLFLFLSGCATIFTPKYVENWPQVKPGMTKSEIEKALGKPDSIVHAFEYVEGQNIIGKAIVNTLYDGWYEKWCYGKSSIILNIVMLPLVPPGNVYIVYFGDQGKVVRTAQPQTKENKKS